MRPSMPHLLAACVALGARAQAPATTNEIAGRIGFSNTNPAILQLLAAPSSRGLHDMVVTAVAEPPAFPASYSADVAASDPVQSNYSITVGADAAGIAYRVRAASRLGPGTQYDDYYFLTALSPPVVEEPSPPTSFDLLECAGVIRVRFVDEAGADVAVQGDRVTASPSLGGTPPLGMVSPSTTVKDLIVRGDGSTYAVRAEISYGSDPLLDRVAVERSASVVVNCDEIVEITVPVPTASSPDHSVIVGRVDVLGETELPLVSGAIANLRSRVEANGPWRNVRADQIAGTPSSGDFTLPNLLPPSVEAPPVPWTLFAEVAIGDPLGFCSTRMPSVDVTFPPGSSVDLGDVFVMQPVTVEGELLLVGPPRHPVRGSLLEDLVLATSRDANRDGVPDDLSRVFDSTVVVARGTNAVAPGATRSAFGASSYGTPAGAFDAATASFAGTHRAVLGNLDSEPGIYEEDGLNLKLVDQFDSLDAERYIDARVDITNAQPPWTLNAGETVTRHHAYCLSKVMLEIDSPTGGAMFAPDFNGDGVHAGLDFRGEPVDYQAHVWWARGLPNSIGRADYQGTAQALLPEGLYQLTPSVRLVGPGNTSTLVPLRPFVIEVGCRQDVRARMDLQVMVLADVEPCPDGPVVVAGTAVAEEPIASIEVIVNGGTPVIACTSCGLASSFSQPVTLAAGDNEIVVRAVNESSRVASVTLFARAAGEPSAVDVDPAAEPLRVTKDAAGLAISWQPEPRDLFNLHAGTLAALRTSGYDHALAGACGRTGSTATIAAPPGDAYFLVTSGCGSGEGSYGRDSSGVERPAASTPCN